MNTYNAVKVRMTSRFTQGGILQTKLFIVSSKKSEYDFIESYIETIKNEPTVYIVDEPQWAVKPEGTFSKKKFKVAVGDKKLRSRVIEEGEDVKSLELQGYRILEVPMDLKMHFTRDIERALMDLAGISTTLVTKFISYESIQKTYTSKSVNPFTNNIISIGTNDNLSIQDFFKPELVDERFVSKPLFIHIDASITGDRTGISGVWAVGLREEYQYMEGDYVPMQELVYKHAFSIGIECPTGAEISLEKNRKFIYYLRHTLGWNVAKVTMDGFQCLPGDTLIKTSNGDKHIIDLVEGTDKVLAFDINSKEFKFVDFTNLRKTKTTNKLYQIKTKDGKVIKCTGNHPILTDRGYVRADELKCSDRILKVGDSNG